MQKNKYVSVIISVAVSFFFVFLGVYGASTISTNISTAGTLTVTGLSSFYGGFLTASSTATSTLMVTGVLTASSTFQASGTTTLYTKLAIGATSSPVQEVSVVGDVLQDSGATTSHVFSSSASGKGGCIQLKGTNGAWFRIYATTTASYVFFEAGGCQDAN